MRFRFLVLLVAPAGCGMLSGLDGLTVDASVDASPIDDASLDVGSSCDAGACGAPSGFEPILFATSTSIACPTGATQLDVVADPLAASNACTCTCNFQPTCLPQPLTVGEGNACATPTKTNVVLDGGCNTYQNGSASPSHASVGPFSPTNACTNTQTTNDKVQGTQGRICNVSDCSACTAPAGFELCFAQNGNVQCPTGMKPHSVGSSASVLCSDCTACSSTAKCKGSLQLYDDSMCFAPDGQITVDGTCQIPTASFFGAFKYVPSVDPGVCTAGTSTPTVVLTPQTTVCCP